MNIFAVSVNAKNYRIKVNHFSNFNKICLIYIYVYTFMQ